MCFTYERFTSEERFRFPEVGVTYIQGVCELEHWVFAVCLSDFSKHSLLFLV